MIRQVVFLFGLLLCLPMTSVRATSTSVYQFDDYEIRATLTREDNALGYELIKIGSNPFSRRLLYPDTTIHINDIVEINEFHVLFGYEHVEDNDTYYDGFLIILSPNGEELLHQTFEEGLDEDITGVYHIGESIIVCVLSLEENDRGQYEQVQMTLYSLDDQFQIISDVRIVDDVEDVLATDQLVLLDYDGNGLFDTAFDEELQRIDANDPLHIPTDAVFVEEVWIPYLNQGWLNRVEYHHGVYTNYPGNYTLEYDGFEYTFTLQPTVEGVVDGGVYNETVTPFVSGGQVLLNGDLFVSGTQVSEPGLYELLIRGIGGYRQTITFTITANMEGIQNNGAYREPIELSFNGIGYLNNQFITSPHDVTEPGEYILMIQGENHYDETYFFQIEEETENYTIVDFLKQFDLYILGITLVSGFLIIKKK